MGRSQRGRRRGRASRKNLVCWVIPFLPLFFLRLAKSLPRLPLGKSDPRFVEHSLLNHSRVSRLWHLFPLSHHPPRHHHLPLNLTPSSTIDRVPARRRLRAVLHDSAQ